MFNYSQNAEKRDRVVKILCLDETDIKELCLDECGSHCLWEPTDIDITIINGVSHSRTCGGRAPTGPRGI